MKKTKAVEQQQLFNPKDDLKIGDKISWKSDRRMRQGEIVGFNTDKSRLRPVIVKQLGAGSIGPNVTLSYKSVIKK